MRKMAAVAIAIAVLVIPNTSWGASSKQEDRLKDARDVLQAIMDTPDKGIPQDLLARAACIGIIPSVKKLAIGIGGEHGAGYVLCRKNNGKGAWGPPSGYAISGGSFGLQLGASATDFVLLFMNADGVQKLLQDKFTLGADLSVAAGPVGRSAAANTDAQMTAKVLSYSRSKGLFGGLALDGAVLRPSGDDNEALYGKKMDPKDILLRGNVAPPAAAGSLIALLTKYSSSQSKKPL
jgi:lipid-binding SYLF domain-containing protein